METIKELLDKLAEMSEHYEKIKADKQKQIDTVSAGIKDALQDIEDEFAPSLSAALENYADQELKVKNAVLALEHSVKGAGIHAVYTQGKTSWDGKKLSGYAAAHPEIEAFKKVGNPSVSIRKI